MNIKGNTIIEGDLKIEKLPVSQSSFSVIVEKEGDLFKRSLGDISILPKEAYIPGISLAFPSIFNLNTTSLDYGHTDLTVSLASQIKGTMLMAPVSMNGTPAFRKIARADLDTAQVVFDDSPLFNSYVKKSGDTISTTDSTPLFIERLVTPINATIGYKTTAGTIYAGNADGLSYAVGNDPNINSLANRWLSADKNGVSTRPLAGNTLQVRDTGGFSITSSIINSRAESILRHNLTTRNVTYTIGAISAGTGNMSRWGITRYLNDRTINGDDGFFGFMGSSDRIGASSLKGDGIRSVVALDDGSLSTEPIVNQLQTLIVGPQTGDISISGGNNIRLVSLFAEQRQDANTSKGAGLTVFTNVANSIGYPTALGGGFAFNRGGSSNFLGSFELWTSSTNTKKVQIRTGATATTFNDWETIATEENIAKKYMPFGGNTLITSKASALDVNDITDSVFYSTGANRPQNANSTVVSFRGLDVYGFQLGSRGNRFSYRNLENGKWSDWFQVYHSGNLLQTDIDKWNSINTDLYVKKTGDTMSNVLHNDKGYSNGIGSGSYSYNETVSITSKKALRDELLGNVLTSSPNGYIYKVTLFTTGTGTINGCVFGVYPSSSTTWALVELSSVFRTINYPYLILEDGIPKVATSHTSSYPINVTVERMRVGVSSITPVHPSIFGWYNIDNRPYTGNNGIVVSPSNVILPQYGSIVNTFAQGNDSRILNGQTAFGWGDHSGLYHPLKWSTPSYAENYSGNLKASPVGSFSATVSTAAANRPFLNVGGLISFGSLGVSTRILGARDNSDNLWFQSGDGTGDWRQIASREFVTSLGYSTQTLTAGANIQIAGNSISSTNTTYQGTASNILVGTTFQRAALTGNVTSPQNSNVLTIANKAVTFAKIQDIPTRTILGRSSAGTGAIETIALGSNMSLVNGVLNASGLEIFEKTTQGGLRVKDWNSSASSLNAIAIGPGANAGAYNAFAFMSGANAYGNSAIAFGLQAISGASHGIAVGNYSSNLAPYGAVFGYGNVNMQAGCTVVGNFSRPLSQVVEIAKVNTSNLPIFIMGNGYSPTIRSNSHEFFRDGSTKNYGRQYYDEDNRHLIDFTKDNTLVDVGYVKENGGNGSDKISTDGNMQTVINISSNIAEMGLNLEASIHKAKGEIWENEYTNEDTTNFVNKAMVFNYNNITWETVGTTLLSRGTVIGICTTQNSEVVSILLKGWVVCNNPALKATWANAYNTYSRIMYLTSGDSTLKFGTTLPDNAMWVGMLRSQTVAYFNPWMNARSI
ncbi:hypothetical protein [Flavobacterium sp. HSC-61S13]|uniref:hypothetical protein n=1 Tax=Flavobacterium sp. HSC-61S13 TaxID=2910963 RepID=UPI00209F346D|nr:hypothetical protein [Flavobacterium sp. HSC-61S13]MCP1996667.1 hypothetical protein [Flavobacterium sp. HSC-61S13]